MTARPVNSFIMKCDVCGEDLPPLPGEEFSPKFATVRDAVLFVRDEYPAWTVQDDGYAVCGEQDESHQSVRETFPAAQTEERGDDPAELPSETVQRAALKLHRRASAAGHRDQTWLRRTAESWEHQANEMAGREEVNVSSDPESDPFLLMADRQGYRHDWTATLAAARALLGEPSA